MMKPAFLSSLALALIAACGQAVTADTPAPSETEAQTVAAPRQSNEPQVGDRIPETDASSESTNRLAAAGAAVNDAASRGVREIGWEELMPEGEEERLAQLYQQQMAMLYSGGPIAEGSAADQMIQIGTFNTVKELNQTKVRIPGYTVPFEFGANAEITEFLLVPYYGACLHAPPPPPNQTLFIMADDPIRLRDLAQAVWVEGTIYTQTQESELADAAYTIKIDKIETYEY
ncbi:MAG: DUF3299 domain-containing protein [Pseudomonadota bacterium]